MPEIAFVRFGPFYPLRILIVAWKENYKNLPLYTGPWLLRAGVCLKEPRLYSACIIHFYFCDNLIFFRCIFMIKTWSRYFWEGKQARRSRIPFSAWSWIKNKFKVYETKKVVHNNPWINVANKWINKKIRIFCYDRTFFAINWLQLIMKRWSQLPYMEESEVSNQREIYSKSN